MKNAPTAVILTTVVLLALLSWHPRACAKDPDAVQKHNRADSLDKFTDMGFGMFIHWSLDSQLGTEIGHSMIGASEDYLERFVNDLPKTFYPSKFQPREWARLAKLAGMKYVVFTTKHHSGFCMFDTKTTDYDIMNTPYGRDITREVVDAFRAEGITVGLYFSVDDFWCLRENGHPIRRGIRNKALWDLNSAQVRQLLSDYGKVDVLFYDGGPGKLNNLAWKLQPQVVITAGAMQTREQFIPDKPSKRAFEVCATMGGQWQYKPTNESYKSVRHLLRLLIETRAQGGNLLLNVGPKPDGELPIEQEERLREIALWMFVNGEAIHGVRQWHVNNEGSYWFTKKKDEDTVYVFIPQTKPWNRGTWKDIVLKSVRATKQTQISVLGQNPEVPGQRPKWDQEDDGLHISALRVHRLYTGKQWPNPVTLKITHARKP